MINVFKCMTTVLAISLEYFTKYKTEKTTGARREILIGKNSEVLF